MEEGWGVGKGHSKLKPNGSSNSFLITACYVLQATAITVTCTIISFTVFPSVNEGTGLSYYLLIVMKKNKRNEKAGMVFMEAVSNSFQLTASRLSKC